MEVARAQGENIPSGELAQLYSILGDRDHAIVWLEKAYEERDTYLPSLKVAAFWDNIRPDPRFQDLVRRMNFPR
jgi:hypothetical protein